MLELTSISFDDACDYIKEHHRHNKPPRGWKFGAAVTDGEKIVGVVMVGRPLARLLDDGDTLEVIRCCTDGTPHVASMLYGAAWRAAKALGYKRLITYTLLTESGVSLRAAGYRQIRKAGGSSWNREKRPRQEDGPIPEKILWQINKGNYIDKEKDKTKEIKKDQD